MSGYVANSILRPRTLRIIFLYDAHPVHISISRPPSATTTAANAFVLCTQHCEQLWPRYAFRAETPEHRDLVEPRRHAEDIVGKKKQMGTRDSVSFGNWSNLNGTQIRVSGERRVITALPFEYACAAWKISAHDNKLSGVALKVTTNGITSTLWDSAFKHNARDGSNRETITKQDVPYMEMTSSWRNYLSQGKNALKPQLAYHKHPKR